MNLRKKRLEMKRPLLVAHRGVCGGNIPCNTKEAFLAAIYQGADVIELDVSMSKDGILYIQHPGLEDLQTNSKGLLSEKDSGEIRDILHVNQDQTLTPYPIITLEEALTLIKGKCFVNIDKFWDAPKQISELVHKLHMENEVIVKSWPTAEGIRALEKYAPDIPYMAICRDQDTWKDTLLHNPNITYIGTEILFDSSSEANLKEYIEEMHSEGLVVWVNSIVYNYQDILAADHTDDIAVTGNPDAVWGWMMDQGFDLVQTDYLLACRMYYEQIR